MSSPSDRAATPDQLADIMSGTRSDTPTSEDGWQRVLHGLYGSGHAKCACRPAKVADIVTAHHLVEIKHVRHATELVLRGQLQHYMRCFPGKRYVIFLFGVIGPRSQIDWPNYVSEWAAQGVVVLFENPPIGLEAAILPTRQQLIDEVAELDAVAAEALGIPLGEADPDAQAPGEPAPPMYTTAPPSETASDLTDTTLLITKSLAAAKNAIMASLRAHDAICRAPMLLTQRFAIEQQLIDLKALIVQHERSDREYERQQQILREYADEHLEKGTAYSVRISDVIRDVDAWSATTDRAYSPTDIRRALRSKCGEPVRVRVGRRTTTCYIGWRIRSAEPDVSETESNPVSDPDAPADPDATSDLTSAPGAVQDREDAPI